jgi:hypothetical protein
MPTEQICTSSFGPFRFTRTIWFSLGTRLSAADLRQRQTGPNHAPRTAQRWSARVRPLPRVLHYLARYTHRVPISNHRIVNVADGKVTFRWKDYAHRNKQRLMTVTAEEFLRRFLLHTLPRGFVRIRFCGFLATGAEANCCPSASSC